MRRGRIGDMCWRCGGDGSDKTGTNREWARNKERTIRAEGWGGDREVGSGRGQEGEETERDLRMDEEGREEKEVEGGQGEEGTGLQDDRERSGKGLVGVGMQGSGGEEWRETWIGGGGCSRREEVGQGEDGKGTRVEEKLNVAVYVSMLFMMDCG